MNRRRLLLLGGASLLLASAPAIVRASSLMPISSVPVTTYATVHAQGAGKDAGKSIPVIIKIDTQRKVRRIEFVQDSLPPDCFIWQNPKGELFVMQVSAILPAV